MSLRSSDTPPHASLARARRVPDNARGPLADYAGGCDQHEPADLKALGGELAGRLVFAKNGVATRGELVTKLFAEHYAPAMHGAHVTY